MIMKAHILRYSMIVILFVILIYLLINNIIISNINVSLSVSSNTICEWMPDSVLNNNKYKVYILLYEADSLKSKLYINEFHDRINISLTLLTSDDNILKEKYDYSNVNVFNSNHIEGTYYAISIADSLGYLRVKYNDVPPVQYIARLVGYEANLLNIINEGEVFNMSKYVNHIDYNTTINNDDYRQYIFVGNILYNCSIIGNLNELRSEITLLVSDDITDVDYNNMDILYPNIINKMKIDHNLYSCMNYLQYRNILPMPASLITINNKNIVTDIQSWK